MDSVILLSVLPFSDGLNLLNEVGVSVILALFVLERFTPDLSWFGINSSRKNVNNFCVTEI